MANRYYLVKDQKVVNNIVVDDINNYPLGSNEILVEDLGGEDGLKYYLTGSNTRVRPLVIDSVSPLHISSSGTYTIQVLTTPSITPSKIEVPGTPPKTNGDVSVSNLTSINGGFTYDLTIPDNFFTGSSDDCAQIGVRIHSSSLPLIDDTYGLEFSDNVMHDIIYFGTGG